MSRFGWAYVNGVITGSGIPGGSDKQVQFNSGSIFSGSQNFVYNYPSSSLQLGNQVTASGQYSFAQGERNVASGYTSHAQGIDTTANAAYSHAEGNDTTASGVSSHAEGQLTLASGVTSHAEGIYSIASGGSSHAEGNTTLASAYGTHAEGYFTTASQNYAHAEGISTKATNYGAHSEGELTLASGEKSHAEGYSTTAFANYSHAEGVSTVASGTYSHAEGYLTVTNGYASHAEGSNTNASGAYSHAEGANTIAVGSFSHAGGEGTISSGSAQTVYGKYNKQNNSTSLFVIGNGTSNASRNDILLVNTNDVVISGSLRVSETLYATEYQTTVVSSSIIYSSGSTKFGDDAGDIHQFTGSILGDIVSGTIARFTTITGSNITSSNFIGNGSNITNLTASNITNFTNDVRNRFSAGTGIIINSGQISASNVPNSSLQNSSIALGTTIISLGATGSIIQGLTTLTASIITGTNAQFTNITASAISASGVESTFAFATFDNISIIAGAVNATIGNTTQSTGKFTTLSASSTIQAGGAITGSRGLSISGGPTTIGGGAGQNLTVSTAATFSGPNVNLGLTTPLTASGGVVISNAPLSLGYLNVTTNFTMTTASCIIGVSASTPVTITLPSASATTSGRYFIIKDEAGNSSTNIITISCSVGSGDTLDNLSSSVINVNKGSYTIYRGGTNKYYIV